MPPVTEKKKSKREIDMRTGGLGHDSYVIIQEHIRKSRNVKNKQ